MSDDQNSVLLWKVCWNVERSSPSRPRGSEAGCNGLKVTLLYSLRIPGELSLRRQRSVKLSDVEIRAVEFLAKRVSEAHAVHTNPVFLDTFINSRMGRIRKNWKCGWSFGRPRWCCQHFSCRVPERFMKMALSCSANPIYELELLPTHVAISLWGRSFKSSHVVFYLDNDAARAALCRGCGGTDLAQRIVQAL